MLPARCTVQVVTGLHGSQSVKTPVADAHERSKGTGASRFVYCGLQVCCPIRPWPLLQGGDLEMWHHPKQHHAQVSTACRRALCCVSTVERACEPG